ncbi:hypothetical protein [Iodobacter sp.]|uniref:hypothetical protein n=1 Tax=Iodobacter sp. TaxID=1915058 RepID=UPI0025EB2D60|nr:hypothetical protein [Iodobacter sp.]
MDIKSPRGNVSIMSRVDFIRMASSTMSDAVLFLTYDTTDERTTKSRSALIDYLSDAGMITVAQAVEVHHSIVMFELASDAVRAWQQINDHSHAVAAHVFWKGLQDDAVHSAVIKARPKEVSPLAHH